jgi:hypothetical protein
MARKPPKGKSLAEVNPELAKQWHTSKNGDLTPEDVSAGSKKKVWWKCEKGNDHEWETSPNARKGCPICSNRKIVLSNCLATTHPEIANQWHTKQNGDLTPKNVSIGSNKIAWWKCDKGDDHIWDTKISYRKEEGCPICSGHRTVFSTSIANTHPHIISEWHQTKNRDLTPNGVSAGNVQKEMIMNTSKLYMIRFLKIWDAPYVQAIRL